MNKHLMEEDPMKRKSNITTSSKILASAILMSGFAAFALQSALAAKTDAAAAPQIKQKEFDTPQQASDSLVQAAASFDMPVLKEILGPESADLVAPKIRSRTKIARPHLLRRRKRRIQLPRMLRIQTALFSRLETTIFLFRFQS